jgi:hypothetical protein
MSSARPRLGRMEVAFACAVFGIAAMASSTGAVTIPEISFRWAPQPGEYVPSKRAPDGQELALIFIGSSTCGASRHEALPAAVQRLKLEMRERALASGRSFTTLGIARDWDVDAGIEHLRRFGRFDEVIAGRNWVNTGLLRYVWEDLPGRAATPQVLVVDRRLVDRNGVEASGGVLQEERLVARLVGWQEIDRWAARGAPMPRLSKVARPDSTAKNTGDVSAVPIR